MKSIKQKKEEQLDRLSDELIDNIINTSDADILKEVEEDYSDPAYEANKVRDLLKKSRVKKRKHESQTS